MKSTTEFENSNSIREIVEDNKDLFNLWIQLRNEIKIITILEIFREIMEFLYENNENKNISENNNSPKN